MSKSPKISICLPIHGMTDGAMFLWRNINVLMEQSFTDFEIIITKAGKMAENTNEAIKRSRGEIIKIIYLDDYLGHNNALKDIVEAFETSLGSWLITSASNNPHPHMTIDILEGNNHLGSPSALAFRREITELFDENMSWLLDVDFYHKLYTKYGPPIILDKNEEKPGVIIGQHDGQMTHILTPEQKQSEYYYLKKKYA